MATNPTNFDVAGARQAGYSDDEILNHLAVGSKFDVPGARKAGYQPSEILDHLRGTNSAVLPPPDVNAALKNLVPRPQVQMNEQYLLGGEPVQPLGQQLIEQAKGTGAAAGNMMMMAPTAIHRSLQSAGVMRPGNAFQQEHTMPQVWQQDIPNAVVTVAGAEPGESPVTGRGKMLSAVPRPPTELPLSPEQQASYTAALDKANEAAATAREAASQKFTKQAETYHGKLSEDFDEAKREHQAAEAGQQQQIEANKQARLEWQQKVDAARESREQAAALEARKQLITQSQQAMAEDTRQRAQSVYQAGRQALDTQWDQIRNGTPEQPGVPARPGVGAETPTPVQGVVNALNKAESEYLRGSPGSVTKFRQLAKELGVEELTGVPDDAEAATTPAGKWYQMNPEQPTAPWQTIRTHASAIGRAMASGDLGNLYPAMKLVRNALEDAAGKVADARGWGEEYRATRASEAQFRKDFEDLGPVSLGKGNPAARLVRAPNAAYASDVIHGKGSDLLEQALNRWDKTGELPTNIQQMRALREELQSLPKSVKVLPEPAPFVEKPVTGGGVPEKKPPTAPELEPVTLKPVERPIPKPPEPGLGTRLASHLPRVIGKVIGGSLGSAVGHPLIGYSVGGEVGSELGKKMTRPAIPAIPRSPEEYTRTILAAKEGAISADEANRRIRRGGGSLKVQPLPSPPQ